MQKSFALFNLNDIIKLVKRNNLKIINYYGNLERYKILWMTISD